MGPKFTSAKVGEITWPGSHDSGAYCKEFVFSKVVHHHWLHYIGTHLLNCLGKNAKQFASDWTRTQALTIRQQLEHGVRYIDLRVSKCVRDNKYYIVHSFCGPQLEDVLGEIGTFVAEHVGECLLVEVDPVSEVDHYELHGIFESKLSNFLLKREQGSPPLSPLLLTISHLMRKGRIILLYRLPALYSPMDNVLYFWDSRWIYAPFVMSLDPQVKEEHQLEKFETFSSDYHGAASKKHQYLFHFMYALTPALGEIMRSSSVFQYCYRPTNTPGSLQECAQRFNPKLSRFIKRIQHQVQSDECYDMGMIISVDFVDESDLLHQVLSLNQSKFGTMLM